MVSVGRPPDRPSTGRRPGGDGIEGDGRAGAVQNVAVHLDASTVGPSRRRPGRPARLSREAIARAAIADGFEDLTLAGVARHLGARHQSLYRYVDDREDVVIAALDLLFAEHRWPRPAGDWRAFVEAEAWARWQLLSEHPGLVGQVRSLRRAPAGAVGRFAAVVGALVELGFEPELAVLTVDSVFALVLDQVARAATPPTPLPAPDPGQQPTLPPPIAATVGRGAAGDPRAWFGEKLSLLLDGVETRVNRRAR